ncbi:MAG: lysylphosphatidylglycerol synthase transmembrane domain-containing protein [bacterium]
MKRILSLAGVLLFVVIIVSAGPREIAGVFRNARPMPFVVALLLGVAMAIAKSWRWKMLLDHADLPTPLFTALRYFLVGNFLGLATPGRVGDFAKSLYFAGRGANSFARATATVFVDRVLDMLVLVVLSSAVFLHHREQLIALPFVCAALVFILIAAKRRAGERILRRVFERMSPGEHRARVGDEFAAFYAQVSHLVSRSRLAAPLLLALLAYALMIIAVTRLADGLRLELPLAFVASSMLLSIFASLVPVSIGGLGSREAVLIACFAQRGLPAEAAVSLSLAMFAVFYLTSAAAGAILWQRKPIPLPSLR